MTDGPTLPVRSDHEQDSLVERLQRVAGAPRDSDAAEALVSAVGPTIEAVVRRVLYGHPGGDDVAQEARLAVLAAASRFRPQRRDPEPAAWAWVVRIATGCAAKHLRADGRRRHHHRLAAEQWYRDEPEAWDEEALRVLNEQLLALPDRHRQALELRYFARLDHSDLGRALSCSPAAARQRVHRALAALRRRLTGAGVGVSLSLLATRLEAASTAALPGSTAIPISGGAAGAATATTTGLNAGVWIMGITGSVAAAALSVVAMSAFSVERQEDQPAPVPAPRMEAESARSSTPAVSDRYALMEWLLAQQDPAGHWSSVAWADLPDQLDREQHATALAVLILLENGIPIPDSMATPEMAALERGLDALAERFDPLATPVSTRTTVRVMQALARGAAQAEVRGLADQNARYQDGLKEGLYHLIMRAEVLPGGAVAWRSSVGQSLSLALTADVTELVRDLEELGIQAGSWRFEDRVRRVDDFFAAVPREGVTPARPALFTFDPIAGVLVSGEGAGDVHLLAIERLLDPRGWTERDHQRLREGIRALRPTPSEADPETVWRVNRLVAATIERDHRQVGLIATPLTRAELAERPLDEALWQLRSALMVDQLMN